MINVPRVSRVGVEVSFLNNNESDDERGKVRNESEETKKIGDERSYHQ